MSSTRSLTNALIWIILFGVIGFAPDAKSKQNLHPPLLGPGSQPGRANLWRADAFDSMKTIWDSSTYRRMAIKIEGWVLAPYQLRLSFPHPLESESVRVIWLTKGGTAIVDAEDYERLSQYLWTTDDDGYPARYFRTHGVFGCIKMHREILSPPDGVFVDHANHNIRDNRKCNLRLCNFQTNGRNRVKQKKPAYSRYKGVSYSKTYGKWIASIGTSPHRHKFLGYFTAETDAALAYNAAASVLYGEFANLNKVCP